MEAMLRGLPVIASDSGGLMEAKQGTGFVIPVNPMEQYEAVFDENHMPRPIAVEQDIAPWVQAVDTLLTNQSAYEAEAARSREAGLRFVRKLDAGDFEKLLLSLQRKQPVTERSVRPAELSAAKRALLLQRLRHQPRR
jgi:glycosyltransferase involved in cell wall biosynthesis